MRCCCCCGRRDGTYVCVYVCVCFSNTVVTLVGKTNGTRKGWPTRNVYTEGERYGEIAGSPLGSKVTYVFPLFAFLSTCHGEIRCKTHLPATTIELFAPGVSLFYTRCHITKRRVAVTATCRFAMRNLFETTHTHTAYNISAADAFYLVSIMSTRCVRD